MAPWRAGIVQYFLGQIDETALLALSESELTKSLIEFALAVRAKQDKRHAAYKKHIKAAAAVATTPFSCYNMFECFLARHEATK